MQRNSLWLFRCRKNMTKLHILFVILKQNSSHTKKLPLFYGEAALYYCSESIYLIFNFFSISLGIAFLCTTIFIVL